MFRRLFPTIVGVFILYLLISSGLSDKFLNSSQDLLFHVRGANHPSQPIIIIGVDEKSQKKLGPWPFPRDIHGALIERLSKARAIGFDFLFVATTEHDGQFSSALGKGPPSVLAVANDIENSLLFPSKDISEYSSHGHVETFRSGDGIVRKVQLQQNENVPSFALALYRLAGFSEEIRGSNEPRLINYLGPEKTFLTLSYFDVIAGKYAKEFFADSLVLVGADDKTLGDSHASPFSFYSSSPGVEIQATILHNLITNGFLKPCDLLSWFIFLLILILALFVWPGQSEILNSFGNCIFLLLLIAITVVLFQYGYLLDIVRPLIFLITVYLGHLLAQTLWLAKKMFAHIHTMDTKLRGSLEHIFHTIPAHLKVQKKQSGTTSLQNLPHRFLQMETTSQALDLQNEFIVNILSEESPPLILWDKNTGKVSLSNKAFDEIWKKNQILSSQVPGLIRFLDLVNTQRILKADIEEIQVESDSFDEAVVDINLPDAKGKKRFYRVSLKHFSLNEGCFVGILAGLTDVTEIKEMERIKDEIVSIVSHELKLPLTTILGYGEMLAEGSGGQQKKYAEKICEQTQRLNRLITDFLDINRLESGRSSMNIYPFDLKYVTEESISAVSLTAAKKHIEIKADLPAKVSLLKGDEQLLLQAIINILDNSIKYSPPETRVKVQLKELQEHIQLIISDQGPGIPSNEQGNIFEKFTRGKSSKNNSGFGLGLSFVKQVIALHEGEVGIINSDNQGTTIVMSLPKVLHENEL